MGVGGRLRPRPAPIQLPPATCAPERRMSSLTSAGTPNPDSAGQPWHREHAGGMLSTDKKSLYFAGIIDILTPFDAIKRLEHRAKAVRYWSNAKGVSCCPPTLY